MDEKKVALITGGTDGIGKATAKKLLIKGWKVVIIGRNKLKCNETVSELKNITQNQDISSILADLSLLSDVKRASEEFISSHKKLDFLFLNANALKQERTITKEGMEWHLALIHLSRSLMAKKLEVVMNATPGSQILTVVGLSLFPIDYDDLLIEKGYSAMKALSRYQWAVLLYSREFNQRCRVPMNIYMPGLVKTKILKNEPQPMRFIVKIANLIMGMPVEKSAENIYSVINDVIANQRKGIYYSINKIKPYPLIKISTTESNRVWDLTNELISKYL
ncbi:MAG: hypothetical protein A2086_09665 [Spirochaetes bacterium GWD1_27_9]|nr:MAG: hypothetical protein A2Z98_11965 [Spirochaetes bacterium GWB1_27_13]OHD20448.1 MAG: hypothetical protein A2Y34_02075 [Spirochaetes bacterium GWC1_27_15]OHD32013.1 MAG: hypothetical protein A2086_09665 [Spirochaetes bacterium GWD1_27_9]